MVLSYFDSSALVPLLISESATARCHALWDRSTRVAASTLAYVEVHAALAQATRLGRITEGKRLALVASFAARWEEMIHISPSEDIVQRAAELAVRHALRGFDAVHCATALAVAAGDMVAVAGDRDLLRAWNDLGLVTADVTGG